MIIMLSNETKIKERKKKEIHCQSTVLPGTITDQEESVYYFELYNYSQ